MRALCIRFIHSKAVGNHRSLIQCQCIENRKLGVCEWCLELRQSETRSMGSMKEWELCV